MGSDAGQDSRRATDIALDYAQPLPQGDSRNFFALLTVWEALAVVLCGCFCATVYDAIALTPAFPSDPGGEFLTVAVRTSILGGLLAPLVLRLGSKRRFSSNATAVFGLAALQVMALLGLLFTIAYLTQTLSYMSRPWVMAWSSMAFVVIAGGRGLGLHASIGGSPQRLIRKQIAIVGHRSATDILVSRLHETCGQRIEIVGVYQDEVDPSQPDSPGQDISRLIESAKHHPLGTVLLAMPRADGERLARAVSQLKALSIDIMLYPSRDKLAASRGSADLVETQMIPIVSRPIGQWGLVLKALEDKVLASVLIVGLLPLMAIIAIAIKVDSPGPVLFRQQRYGLNNTKFNILKFRTMSWGGYGTGRGHQQTQRNDPRTTRVGQFLRRSSLDELPQLLNVLRGEMSLVGPRPHPTVMLTGNRLSEEIVANYAHRHRVKPGLTGWAQINGFRGATSTDEQIRRRVEYDLLYIENWSIFFDLKILALTPIRMVLDSDGAF
jgi:Undecaprenyl-phosphate glucose phosphotransferase